MHAQIKIEPASTFYLATDDPEVKNTFRREFGARLYSGDIRMARTTKEGMQDALVELYTLSGTSQILGSYWSSYSKVAAELGGIPLTRVVHQP
jgi:hypothetical protein